MDLIHKTDGTTDFLAGINFKLNDDHTLPPQFSKLSNAKIKSFPLTFQW